MTKPRIPRDLLDPIVAYFKPQRVILFGSRARGEATFPVPTLTEKNKLDLTRCAEDILLAREAHFPATIAELYDPDKMPADLRDAHERNDEVLERIYIGRRFRNDTERTIPPARNGDRLGLTADEPGAMSLT
jgi:predicted nucleotidyltransferase